MATGGSAVPWCHRYGRGGGVPERVCDEVSLVTGNPDCAARSTLETLGPLVFVFLRTDQYYGL